MKGAVHKKTTNNKLEMRDAITNIIQGVIWTKMTFLFKIYSMIMLTYSHMKLYLILTEYIQARTVLLKHTFYISFKSKGSTLQRNISLTCHRI
jgi:hypothetical protein